MTYGGTSSLKYVVNKVIKYQFIQGVIAVILITVCTLNLMSFISAVFGLLIALIPSLVYAKVVVGDRVDNFYVAYQKHKKALLLKFIVNAMGFFMVFLIFKNVSASALFVAYVITLSGHWTSLISSMVNK